MATSGEFRFLTIGLLLVVVGLTGAEDLVTCEEELTLQENELFTVFTEGNRPGYVYLLREEISFNEPRTFFKVGRSIDPKRRHRCLQTGNARQLVFVDAVKVKDNVSCERRLKFDLSKYKSQLGGGTEWFVIKSGEDKTLEDLFHKTVKEKCY